MNRLSGLLGKYYYSLKNRPQGTATIGVFAGAMVVLCLLAAGFVYEPVRQYVLAISIALAVVLLTLVVALLSNLRAKLNDVHYAISLENGLRRAGYEPEDFFTDEAAGNPSLQLLNLKILRFCQPKQTLELGSGQTTKLLTCYKRQNPDAYVLTLEQNADWARRLGAHMAHDCRHVGLERKEFTCSGTGLKLCCHWYKDVPELREHRFDYVLVDGPDHGNLGTEHLDYSRCGILQYIPALLAPSFIIVFDDAERYGETMTISALEGILTASGIQFIRFARHGIKTQVVLCSKDLAYFQSV